MNPLELSYYEGLRTPGDPESLEDIGIPTSPESFERHVRSGRAVIESASIPKGVEVVRGLFCGDCTREIEPGGSCAHMNVDGSGRARTIG